MFKNRKKLIWFCMITAFIAGILFVNFSMDAYLEKEFFTLRKIVKALDSVRSNKQEYFYFLLKTRLTTYVVLGLLCGTLSEQIGLILYGSWFCFTEGICMTTVFFQERVSGIWSMLLVQLPYILCYGMVYVYLIQKCVGRNNEKRRYFIVEWLKQLPIMIIGIGLECYVSPYATEIIKKWFI